MQLVRLFWGPRPSAHMERVRAIEQTLKTLSEMLPDQFDRFFETVENPQQDTPRQVVPGTGDVDRLVTEAERDETDQTSGILFYVWSGQPNEGALSVLLVVGKTSAWVHNSVVITVPDEVPAEAMRQRLALLWSPDSSEVWVDDSPDPTAEEDLAARARGMAAKLLGRDTRTAFEIVESEPGLSLRIGKINFALRS